MVDSETFRDAMRSWATGVTIITTQTSALRHGMTLNSFTSLSLEPPLVLVCVQNNVRMMSLLRESKKFAVSVLRAGQEDISNRFAGRSTEHTDRFAGLNTLTAVTGSPILKNALAYFDCTIGSMYPGGTHTVIIGRVLAAKRFEGESLIYWNRDYREIGAVGAKAEADPGEFLKAFAGWRSEALSALNVSVGLSQVLLQGDLSQFTEEQRQDLKLLYTNSQRTLAAWHDSSDYLRFRYGTQLVHWEPVSVNEEIENAIKQLPVERSASEALPKIKSWHGGMANLVSRLINARGKTSDKLNAAIKVEVYETLGSVNIQIHTNSVFPELGHAGTEPSFYPGTNLSIAQLILQKHGSELKIQTTDQGAHFEFDLPLWLDGPSN